MSCIYTRQELYELIWEKPIRTIAQEIGVSDSALGKACRRAGITRPDQGYWAKKKAGKATQKRLLAPRFPGASVLIQVGGNRYGYTPEHKDDTSKPLPAPPTFDEDLDSLLIRINKMVGRVPFPALSNGTHPIISKLLEQDDKRKTSSWETPEFDSAIEKRRLRIINAIFLYCNQIGCRPFMDTTKYGSERDRDRDPSVKVGDHNVSIKLIANKSNKRVKGKHKATNFLRLSIGNWKDKYERFSWEDTDESRIEKLLRDIVTKIVYTGELQHREHSQEIYDWKVERRVDILEKERQRVLKEELIANELKEQFEKVRVDKLLSEASALKQAIVIREYVESIRSKSIEIDVSQCDIDKWSEWALEQADRIDPVKSLSFLNLMDGKLPTNQ